MTNGRALSHVGLRFIIINDSWFHIFYLTWGIENRPVSSDHDNWEDSLGPSLDLGLYLALEHRPTIF